MKRVQQGKTRRTEEEVDEEGTESLERNVFFRRNWRVLIHGTGQTYYGTWVSGETRIVKHDFNT